MLVDEQVSLDSFSQVVLRSIDALPYANIIGASARLQRCQWLIVSSTVSMFSLRMFIP